MKYSICIPAYKANFLKECIESVLAQDSNDFELIILNDKSPENLLKIIEEFPDERIRYFENGFNVGAVEVVKNWNKCLELAKGDFIVMMGDDDIIAPNFLTIYSELIAKHPDHDLYHCRSIIIDVNGSPLALTPPRPQYESVYDSIIERMNGRIFFIGDYLFRTASLKEVGGFFYLPLAWGADDLTAYNTAVKRGTVHTNEPIFMYRRTQFTISSNGSVDQKMIAICKQNEWFNRFILLNVPDNKFDIILWIYIKNNYEKYIQKTKIRTVYSSLAEGSSKVLHWLLNRKKFDLSLSEIVYAIILSYKEKYK